MLCKVCNTRIRPGGSACPNCGSHSFVDSSRSSSELGARLPLPKIADDSMRGTLDDAEPAPARDDAVEPDPGAEAKGKAHKPVEVELNEPAEVGEPAPGRSPEDSGSEPK